MDSDEDEIIEVSGGGGGSTTLTNYKYVQGEAPLTFDEDDLPSIILPQQVLTGPVGTIELGELFIYGEVDGDNITQAVSQSITTDNLMINMNSFDTYLFTDNDGSGSFQQVGTSFMRVNISAIESAFDVENIGSPSLLNLGPLMEIESKPHFAFNSNASTLSTTTDGTGRNGKIQESSNGPTYGYRILFSISFSSWSSGEKQRIEASFISNETLSIILKNFAP